MLIGIMDSLSMGNYFMYMIMFFEKVTKKIDEGSVVDIYKDFSKTMTNNALGTSLDGWSR